MNDEIELGEDHKVRLLKESDGSVWALVDSHPSSIDGSPCGGTILLGEDEWTLVCIDPLTIMPSIDCDLCESHGVINEGKWEIAHYPEEEEADENTQQESQTVSE